MDDEAVPTEFSIALCNMKDQKTATKVTEIIISDRKEYLLSDAGISDFILKITKAAHNRDSTNLIKQKIYLQKYKAAYKTDQLDSLINSIEDHLSILRSESKKPAKKAKSLYRKWDDIKEIRLNRDETVSVKIKKEEDLIIDKNSFQGDMWNNFLKVIYHGNATELTDMQKTRLNKKIKDLLSLSDDQDNWMIKNKFTKDVVRSREHTNASRNSYYLEQYEGYDDEDFYN